jgi:hypothetical protein
MSERMAMSRVWAMPNADTFSVEPIHNFVWKYLHQAKVSVDPFARNKKWATYTNDMNPNTEAQSHMEAADFFAQLDTKGAKADLVLLDPPYSPRQTKECYESFGMKMQTEDAWGGQKWRKWRNAMLPILTNDAVVLSFGWNTSGMGKARGFEIEEILLVCHGSDHNDTICMAERRCQMDLFA